MSQATPLPTDQRALNYMEQNGLRGNRYTPRQRRRLDKKRNQAQVRALVEAAG